MDTGIEIQKKFYSFPYNQKLWILTINQLVDVDNTLVFSNEVTKGFDLIEYDFDLVTDLIIGTGINEFHAHGDHTQYLQNTIFNCHIRFPNLQNIYILYTTVSFNEDKIISKCPVTCMYLPYFLLRSTLTDTTQFTKWTTGDKKAIFPIGDIRNRPHRFPLLFYFKLQDDLDLLNYSLHNIHYNDTCDYFSSNHIQRVCNWLSSCFEHTYNFSEFENLYNSLVRYFPKDQIYINRQNHFGLSLYTHCYPGGWNDASCMIVAETAFDRFRYPQGIKILNAHADFYFSEKIWKPILSQKPFITISENDAIYHQLEKMGFKTFLNYTDCPEKTEFTNIPVNDALYYKKHIILCHKRVKSFLNNIETYKDEILEDTLYNLEKWKEVSSNAWEDLYSTCPPTRHITKDDFCDMFNNHVFHDVKYRYINWRVK